MIGVEWKFVTYSEKLVALLNFLNGRWTDISTDKRGEFQRVGKSLDEIR